MNYLMLLSGAVLAAGGAYLGNRALYHTLGRRAAVVAVPWWEEACKLAVSVMMPGLPLAPVHLVFGAVESAYNLLNSPSAGLLLGCVSLVAHGLTGAAAALAAGWGFGLWGIYLVAGLVHVAVNMAVVSMVLPALARVTVPK